MYIDIYIDDTIGVTPDLNNNTLRMNRVIPLAIRTLACPVNPSDMIPRKDIISMKKYAAEGRLEEVKKVLGWVLNTRSLKISLPSDKYKDWSGDISKMLLAKKSHHKHLETLIGRLNHVACIFPPMRHFMGRLYQALYRSSISNGWTAFFSNELANLEIFLSFLNTAHKGLSMNNLVYRRPTLIYRSDASEFGMGGYNLTSGIAWRFELPLHCRNRTSLNSLEFLACVISIWVDSFHNVIEPESCLLTLMDSTTALGWIRKSNFADKSDEFVQLSTAQQLASLVLSSETSLYSQWFPGEQNTIADSLSRDFRINDTNLSSLLISHFLDQVPYGLDILPVPPNIVSWLTCLLLSQPQKEPWLKEPMRSKFALGLDSIATLCPLDSRGTLSLTTSILHSRRKSLVPLPMPSERADFVMQNIVNPSSPSQSTLPWTAYHRSLSWLTDQTQGWTEMANLHYFYSANSEDTAHQTPQSDPKLP